MERNNQFKKNFRSKINQESQSKIITERKTFSNFKYTSNTQRQNIVTYLDSIKSNHSQIQNNLQKSHLDRYQWRSLNHTPSKQSNIPFHKQKNNTLFTLNNSRIQNQNQFQAIKIYNHVHNKQNIKTNDQPKINQFIEHAISKSTRINKSIDQNDKKQTKSKFIQLQTKNTYTVCQSRKQLQKLQNWIKDKVQTYKKSQNKGQIMITDRINFLNLAFCQISRIAGTYSTQIKAVLEYVMNQYHEYYSFITDCMSGQNTKLKSQIGVLEERLHKTINFYEQNIRTIKNQYEQKSEKVFHNFHKCVELKKILEKQNKEMKKTLTNERNKLKFMQQGLIKITTLFSTLGEKSVEDIIYSFRKQDMVNLKKKRQIQNTQNSLNQIEKKTINFKLKDEKELEKQDTKDIKLIFQEWCKYIIKPIHKMVMKDMKNDKNKKNNKYDYAEYLENQAFQVIQKYMVQNDGNLSLDDAKKILNQFIVSPRMKKKKSHKQKGQVQETQDEKLFNELQTIQNNEYELPTIEEVFEKFYGVEMSVQASIPFKGLQKQIQTFRQCSSIEIMVAPRTRNKEVNTNFKNNHLELQSLVWQYKQEKVQRPDITPPVSSLKRQRKRNVEQEVNILLFQPFQKQNVEVKSNRNSTSTIKSKQSKKISFDKNEAKQNLKIQESQKLIKFVEEKLILNNQEINIEGDEFISQEKNIINKTHKQSKQQEIIQVKNIKYRPSMRSNFRPSKMKPLLKQQLKEIQNQLGHERKSQFQKILNSGRIRESYPELSEQDSNNESFEMNISTFSKKHIERRKQGMIILKHKKKEQLSLKYIADSDHQELDDCNDSSSQIIENASKQQWNQLTQEQKKIKRLEQFNSIDYCKQKFKTLQEKVARYRSFANLRKVEYASSKQAQISKIQKKLIRISGLKKLKFKENIDTHEFHMHLALKNQQKLKFLSSVIFWNPKVFSEIKRNLQKIKILKPKIQLSKESTKLYIKNTVNPIINDYLKLYQSQRIQNLNDKNGQNFKQLLHSFNLKKPDDKKGPINLSYSNRLCPLVYLLVQHSNKNKGKNGFENENLIGLKLIKKESPKMEVYNMLIEDGCTEFDIFIRSVHYFNLKLDNSIEGDFQISNCLLEDFFIESLEKYFNEQQAQKIIKQVQNFPIQKDKEHLEKLLTQNKQEKGLELTKKNSKQILSKSSINFYQLLKIIYKHISEKKNRQQNRYSIISTILSKGAQSTTYEDVIHFLNCLPISRNKKNKILYDCRKNFIYWQKNQPTILNSILYFILDKNQIYKDSKDYSKVSLINEYITNTAELYFKATLNKLIQAPDWILKSIYAISYKTPVIFHKLINQLRIIKDRKQKRLIQCLLTILFCHTIDEELVKHYVPSLFNGLLSIPSQ